MNDCKTAEAKFILLDLIRYFLAIVVVIGHGLGFYFDYFNGFFPEIFPYPQSIAVMCFFYLSGFLIVGSKIGNRDKNKGGLWWYLFDRFSRIYITLIPSILFVGIVDFFFHNKYSSSYNLVVNYSSINIFLSNLILFPSMPYGTMRPVWSLMYEWWIYILFGGIFYLRSSFFFGLLLILFGAYFTFHVNALGEAGHIWVIWLTGAACAYLKDKIMWRKLNSLSINLLCFFLFLFSIYLFYTSKNSYNIIAGISLALSIFLFTNKNSKFLASILRFKFVASKLAGYSFTLFLTHYTVLIFVNEVLSIEGGCGFVVGFILSNIVAYIIAKFTEFKLAEIKNAICIFCKYVIKG